jgi:hypothetical protein
MEWHVIARGVVICIIYFVKTTFVIAHMFRVSNQSFIFFLSAAENMHGSHPSIKASSGTTADESLVPRPINFGRVAIKMTVPRTLRGAHSNYLVHAKACAGPALLRVAVNAAVGSGGDTRT